MTKLESFFYALLYAYFFLGIGYFSNKLINHMNEKKEIRKQTQELL